MALRLRDQLEGRQEKSETIAVFLRASQWYREAKRVFLYLSFRSEVDTWKLLEQIWNDGKETAVPRTEGTDLVFCLIESREELMSGFCGIQEPLRSCQTVRPKVGDLILVPGAAFDGRGFRMGYGGGFYDRFLSGIPGSCRRIGLAFESQVFEEIPTDLHDCRLDGVITEKGVHTGYDENNDSDGR